MEMSIRRFEVSTPFLERRWNIPATASLICDQRKLIRFCDFSDEIGVGFDGVESVGDGEVCAFEAGEGRGDAGMC